jgi:hypothetical protein
MSPVFDPERRVAKAGGAEALAPARAEPVQFVLENDRG